MKKKMYKVALTGLSTFMLSSTSLFASNALCDNDNKMTISVEEGQELSAILTAVADKCKYTITYSDKDTYNEFKNTPLYSLNMYDKTMEEVLDILVHKNNFYFDLDKERNIISLSKVQTKTFKVNFIDMVRKGQSSAEVTISAESGQSDSGATIDTKEETDFWTKLEEDIEKIILRPEDTSKTEIKPVVNRKAGMLTVTGTYKQLERIEDYLSKLINAVSKQVLIDVKIIAVDLDKSHETGVDWSKFNLGYTFSGQRGDINYINVNNTGNTISDIVSDRSSLITYGPLNTVSRLSNIAFDMAGVVNFLDSFGDSKTMSSPKVTAMNNQPTLISVGDNINYIIKSSTSTATSGGAVGGESETPASLFVGVLLDITPHIDDNNLITLRINPSISELKYAEDATRQSVARTLPPDTTTRRISSIIQLKDGQTVVLGGLMNQRQGKTTNKVNFLGDLPLLGDMFKSTSDTTKKTELVFIIKAKIIDLNQKDLNLTEKGFSEIDKRYEQETEELIFSPKTESTLSKGLKTIKHSIKEAEEKRKYEESLKKYEEQKAKELNNNKKESMIIVVEPKKVEEVSPEIIPAETVVETPVSVIEEPTKEVVVETPAPVETVMIEPKEEVVEVPTTVVEEPTKEKEEEVIVTPAEPNQNITIKIDEKADILLNQFAEDKDSTTEVMPTDINDKADALLNQFAEDKDSTTEVMPTDINDKADALLNQFAEDKDSTTETTETIEVMPTDAESRADALLNEFTEDKASTTETTEAMPTDAESRADALLNQETEEVKDSEPKTSSVIDLDNLPEEEPQY